MIYRYCCIVIACVLLLTGLQVPAFVDQYEKRLDAHLIEVTANLRGFQEIADEYYEGSIDALIKKHESSTDLTFQLEAKPIADMYNRYRKFLREKEQLDTNLVYQIVHIVHGADNELLEETINSYTYTITLNKESVISGAVLLIVGLLIADLLSFSVSAGIRRHRRGRRT